MRLAFSFFGSFSLRAAVLAAALALPLAAPAVAQRDVTRDELAALEAERDGLLAQLNALEQAEGAAVADLSTLETKLIAAASEARRREEQATVAEMKLATLRARLVSARQDLRGDEAALEELMASLALSGRHRPPALLTQPDNANEAIRAAIVMGEVAPLLNERTAALTTEIDALRKLERLALREQTRLEAAEAGIALKQEEILQMTAQKRAAYADVAGDVEGLRARAKALGAEANTVRELLAALEAGAPTSPGLKPRRAVKQYAALKPSPPAQTTRSVSRAALGQLTRPAAGRLVRAWGEKMADGSKSPDMVTATRSAAQVVSPVDGTVIWSQSLRSYSQLLIIKTSGDYLIVMSGMAESYVSQGQTVKRGEPVARMHNRISPEPELSLEVRDGDKSINPAKFIARG